jgi:hypothetical protein
MTKKPTIFSATPGTVLDFDSFTTCAAALIPLFRSTPSLHFVIVVASIPRRFYVMSFSSWRHLLPSHPACGTNPLFSGSLNDLRALTSAFPPEFKLPDSHA